MTCSPNRAPAATMVLAVLGAAYPFAVYGALGRVPAGALALTALALVAARIVLVRGHAAARSLLPPLVAAAVITALLAFIDAAVAAKAYPVAMSLAFSAAFGLSLLWPPSLVELFAAAAEPDPSPRARAYMRRVSLGWSLFLAANALVSAATALWAETWLWALYNGLLSYLLMGTLFLGEWLVRRRVRR